MLVAASQYFDAAVNSEDRTVYDIDFLISGASAYFLSDDFGSAKVMSLELCNRAYMQNGSPQDLLLSLFGYLLLNQKIELMPGNSSHNEIQNLLLQFYATGQDSNRIVEALSEYRRKVYDSDVPMDIYYVDILYAVITVALSKSAWALLPVYSESLRDNWMEYLKTKNSIKML